MEDNTVVKDQAATTKDEEPSVDEDTPSPEGESKPSATQEPATKSGTVEDKTGTSPEQPAALDGQTPSQGGENTPNKPTEEKESSEMPVDDQAATTKDEEPSVGEDTPSPEGESKPSATQEPATKSETVEDKTGTSPAQPAALDGQTPSQGGENTPNKPTEEKESSETPVDDQAATTKDEEPSVDEDTPSPEGESKPSATQEPATKSETVEDRTGTSPEQPAALDGQTPSQGGENTPNKPTDKEEPSKTLVDDIKVNTETAQEEHTDADRLPQSPPEESKQPDTEKLSETTETVKVPEKDKKTAPAEQTTVDAQTSPPGEESKPSFTGEPSKTSENVMGSNLGIIIAIACVLVAIIVGFILSRNTSEVATPDKPAERCNPHKEDCGQFLRQSIHKLKEKYGDQASNSWRTLHAAALSHVSLQPKPVRPIVILVYWVNSSNHQILYDISKVYSSVLSGSKGDANIEIKGMDFVDQESESVQKRIAGELERGFEDGKKVAIIHDFDNLPSCSVLTFHNYCNNEDAPYTDVAIILTMKGNPEMEPEQKPKVLEESVSTIFHKKWSDCPEDLPPGKIDAILSRVANNVVLLR